VSRQKLGQHFLVRGSVLERIARAACPEPPEPLVIEIGPGKGALTERLLGRAQRVIAVEMDPALVAYLNRKFSGVAALTLITGDARQTDLAQWGPAVIAGNLPYYAATPILEQVAALGANLRRGIFLIQKEVAARLIAVPGTRDYGYLTVRTQLFVEVKALIDVKPAAFQPPPKVDSTVIRLEPRPRAAELGLSDTGAFLEFVSQAFRHKRKTLRNNLALALGKSVVDSWPEAGMRAEQLSLEQFAALYHRAAGVLSE
jgi:16S rRNA (adenine1518-N6/adenine1519-N6)-dimethyltransferase